MKRDPDKARTWRERSVARYRQNARERGPRAPLSPMSAKRRTLLPERSELRQRALQRAGDRCEMAEIVPEVRCAFYGGRGLEVDELRGGAYRSTEWLDLDRVAVGCPAHHDWKTDHKREFVRRWESHLGG
jgi:hypothetical protein